MELQCEAALRDLTDISPCAADSAHFSLLRNLVLSMSEAKTRSFHWAGYQTQGIVHAKHIVTEVNPRPDRKKNDFINSMKHPKVYDMSFHKH